MNINTQRRDALETILRLVTIDRYVKTDDVLDSLLRQLLNKSKRKGHEQPYQCLRDGNSSVSSSTGRNITSFGLDIIKEFEGLRLKAYKCPGNVWTIGYGHTQGVKPGMVITQAQANSFLVDDIAKFCNGVNKLVKVPITQNQFDALVSFTFNVGIGAFQKSTLLKRLNNRDYHGTANEFDRWVYAGKTKLQGLVKRRKKEKRLFLSGL